MSSIPFEEEPWSTAKGSESTLAIVSSIEASSLAETAPIQVISIRNTNKAFISLFTFIISPSRSNSNNKPNQLKIKVLTLN